MDRQSSQAIESLQISTLIVRSSVKDVVLLYLSSENWLGLESYGNNSSHIKENDVKQLKQELADLLEEDATYDKLRSLPLYSCRITGWKFVCSKCYDKAYNNKMLFIDSK
jgi:hypothetical protein